ncbi:isocitrate lyase/PEP mutase family protein [Nonomuraea maritima]|uniref:isocitrate lyase/PEP mutase family protein n=1 Tax=Nonomuraea maritima TaxID=683260 RepID=UPI00371C38B4
MTTDRAATMRALHVPGKPLVLPNVWDAASARAVRDAGFPAVATGSAAVARVLGYDDGERTPVAEMLAAVTRVARAVDVPVTADLERGYGLRPAELAERLTETGAVGLNLEDTDPRTGELVDPGAQADYLAGVRAAGPELVINARVDVHVHGNASYAETVRRARRYLEAGADCVYPIFLADEDEIRALVAELGRPVNILARPGAPDLSRLAELGVARISFGSGIHNRVHAHAEKLLADLHAGASPF